MERLERREERRGGSGHCQLSHKYSTRWTTMSRSKAKDRQAKQKVSLLAMMKAGRIPSRGHLWMRSWMCHRKTSSRLLQCTARMERIGRSVYPVTTSRRRKGQWSLDSPSDYARRRSGIASCRWIRTVNRWSKKRTQRPLRKLPTNPRSHISPHRRQLRSCPIPYLQS